MIGNPSNFVHTGHLGSDSNNLSMHLQSLQKSMAGKGGYDSAMHPVNVQMKVIDVQN